MVSFSGSHHSQNQRRFRDIVIEAKLSNLHANDYIINSNAFLFAKLFTQAIEKDKEKYFLHCWNKIFLYFRTWFGAFCCYIIGTYVQPVM